MLPSDIGNLVAASSPAVSPDGGFVAFVVTRVDLPGNQYRSAVWLAPTDGSGPAQQLTAGDGTDGSPTWSPDGRRLAFTSRRGEEAKPGVRKASLHVLPISGPGETVTIATSDEGIGDVRWSPDGTWLAYTTRVRDARYEHDDPRKQPPRRITRFFSRLDSVGWVADRPQQLFVARVDASEAPRNLTPTAEAGVSGPSWLPDSSGLLIGARLHDTWDLDLAVDLYRVVLDGGDPERLTKGTGSYMLPSTSPDGARVAFVGTDDPLIEPQNAKVGVLDLATGERRWVSEALDRTFAPYPGAQAPVWEGEELWVGAEDRGAVHLYACTADGSRPPRLLVGGERAIAAWDRRGGVTAIAVSTPVQPSEIVVVGDDGSERRVSSVTDAFCAKVEPRQPERFAVPASNGEDIDAWIMTPHGFDPAKRYPALLNIHGGPFTQYGERFFDEFQLQARAGFVVVYANPRGGSGRDTAWGTSIRAGEGPLGGTGWGSVDYDDLMAVVDAAIERYSFIDADRFGVLGGSYGGYMTSWIVGHTDRFKAACSERAVNNLLTMEWTSDIATVFRTELGTSYLDDPELYLRLSPITYVRNITTPVLIVHSEDDLRCPISQGEELFTAMRLLGKEVEFVRFPAESHELSRSGSPVHRQQRAEILLEFFGRHLSPEPA